MLEARYFLLLLAVVSVNALPQIKLGGATIVGRSVSDSVQFFGGIPFAEPPLGGLRLNPPVLKTRLPPTVLNASSYGNACVQPPIMDNPPPQSEDCLFINVYRPASVPKSQLLPVMFFTPGGAFVVGGSNRFDGKDLVAHSVERGTPIIYVNHNYRLGPLGFPQGQEADDEGALNLGVLDQIAALEWVQANIHAFGGDKDKVTIAGLSAGAMMVGVLFLNPQLGKLARAGILESGSSNGVTAFPASRNEAVWQAFVEKVPSCARVASTGRTFECLKEASTEEVALAMSQIVPDSIISLKWAPTLDFGRGSVYPDYASRLYEEGRFARLPFIAGTNRDEGTLFSIREPLTQDAIKDIIVTGYSPAATTEQELNRTVDKLLELYPEDPAVGSPYGTGEELFGLPASYKRVASLYGDLTFNAPRRQWSQAAAKAGVKSYAYHFTHPQAIPALGVPHGSESPYVYAQPPPTDPVGQEISNIMADYWISFTVSLTPNDGKGVKRPEWPQYTTKNQVVLQLEGGNTTAVEDDFRKEQLDFLIKNSLVLRR
ncbi:hypothetical protein D9611_012081 [Ephemerocybe angulata]|uniref:Carboxylic ester hydrolase n=1 Tax=Ephemerocybe angulata TaxID=980116 RepID=A0A8H5ASY0_9AGAR|nr:hypothetical protein D9611_012081 [Tulosesus angulatus]